MSTQALLKKITALKISKYRQKYGQFAVEGLKGVSEIIHSDYKVHKILVTNEFIQRHDLDAPYDIISTDEMKKISSFSTAPGVLAVANIKTFEEANLNQISPITLCLDGISDPGNLGTLIRTADWFGINQIVLSENCTDFYNPKVLSASMGSFCRCEIVYTNLAAFLNGKNSAGFFLNGENIADFKPNFPIYLVIGSESHGISDAVTKVLKTALTIPGYGKAESLNAGIAAGIALYHMSALANH